MRVDLLSPRLLPYAVTVGFLGAGALLGLVVATGRLVPIALVIGGVAGLVLLNALPLAVWLLIPGVLLVSGPVGYFFPGLSKISWLFSLLGVFMSGAALLYAAAGRERPARPLPWFVVTALLLAVLALLSTFFSNGSMAEISAGLKRQFQFWGVVFLFAVYPFSGTTVKRWLVFMLGVALVQLPFTAYQRFVLVPQVMGFEAPGFVPFDIIVGSFEGSMFGGGSSAIMAMYQVVATVGLYCAFRERLIGGLTFAALLVLVAAPLALGETKVVLFLIPIVLLAAYCDTIAKRPLAFAGGVVATIALGAVLGYVYFLVQVAGDVTLEENLANTLAYNFGERGYYGTGVNRLTAVPYWFESQTWAEPMRTLFGWGIGSAYGVDGRVPLPGHIFVAHPGMHIDLVSASQMLWELGAVGTLLFYATFLGALIVAKRNLDEAKSAWDTTFCRIALGSLGASFLMSFYSSSMLVLVSHSFLLALTLGLIAWRSRHGPMALTARDQPRHAGSPGPVRMKGKKFRHWQDAMPSPGPAFTPAGQGGAAFASMSDAASPAAGVPRRSRPNAGGASGAAWASEAAWKEPLRADSSRAGGPSGAGFRDAGFADVGSPSAARATRRPSFGQTPDTGGPMFATDVEPDADEDVRGARSRRPGRSNGDSGSRGRIEPVIDIEHLNRGR